MKITYISHFILSKSFYWYITMLIYIYIYSHSVWTSLTKKIIDKHWSNIEIAWKTKLSHLYLHIILLKARLFVKVLDNLSSNKIAMLIVSMIMASMKGVRWHGNCNFTNYAAWWKEYDLKNIVALANTAKQRVTFLSTCVALWMLPSLLMLRLVE